ncbi:ribosome maturation factor RimM [Jeotgalibaca sp. MA1X17-3]|uniref:ribosome maturation factor RimM n=1 Tax=Jeotgalibaca sp. MA1X17-3 TaxID=2908211 RepID=UPI001EE9D85B|nr:ribosome maturation factor RimM [Jeotgalibaca sp. MA1X17-3]UJF14922.1 ribosome maturation factor RimM [Jeotgalibaca sp. MA1X17-3]
MEKYFDVGKIVNTQGLKGEVRVISFTDFAEKRYEKGNSLMLFQDQKSPIELTIKSHRKHKNFDLLMFEGFHNINQVEPFKGGTLRVSADEQHELEEMEYYYHEIIGLSVISDQDEELGKIKEILPLGSNDVWVVTKKGQKDLLIPYIKDVVKEVDLESGMVRVTLLEGMRDE